MRSNTCRVRSGAAGWRGFGSAPSRSSPAVAPAARRGDSLHRARRRARLKHLVHLAVDDALLVLAARVAADHPPPEAHRIRVAQVLGDLPASCEAIEDELDRRAPDAEAPPRARDEE